jgi:hypothetical protein
MVPPERLSQYLSNELWGFNGVVKLPIFFGILILVTNVDMVRWYVATATCSLGEAPVLFSHIVDKSTFQWFIID